MMKAAVAKVWDALFGSRPRAYICLVLAAALVSYAYWFRTNTIFSCQADGYSSDRYLAYCDGANYADYEHEFFRFALEPSIQDFAGNADVMFLSNSRLQAAFSTVATVRLVLGCFGPILSDGIRVL
jgi:hypothetical protein